jgi:RES domain-containing protein
VTEAEAIIKPHPDSVTIQKGIARCAPLAALWSGDLFRATAQDYANRRDLLTGEGARKAGGRYNARGAFRALYSSLNIETALGEALSYSRQQGIPDSALLPLTFVCMRVVGLRTLDLTSGKVRHALGISKERLLRPWRAEQHAGWEALTQAIGRLAREAGVQAILYDSAQTVGGRNMVLFPDPIQPHQLQLVNREQLPDRRRMRK